MSFKSSLIFAVMPLVYPEGNISDALLGYAQPRLKRLSKEKH
jgi:hypothetical protein